MAGDGPVPARIRIGLKPETLAAEKVVPLS